MKKKKKQKAKTKSKVQVKKPLQSPGDLAMLEVAKQIAQKAKEAAMYKKDETFQQNVTKSAIAQQAHLNVLRKEREIDEHLAEMDKSYSQMRKAIIDGIRDRPEDAEKIRNVALGLINIEKEYNSYDPENWKGVFD